MNIIILTENKVGEGHYKAAKAIQNAFKIHYGEKVRATITFGLRKIHPSVEWAIVHTYFGLITYTPKTWGYIYSKTRKSPIIQRYLFALKLYTWLKKERPDVIICTHPACIPALSEIKKRAALSFRLGFILTDYDFHPFSVSPYVDEYFVAHESIKNRLVEQYQISSSRVFDYGIPLEPHFDHMTSSCPNEQCYQHILLMGGSCGIGPLEEILTLIQAHDHPFLVTVICGNNQALYKRLQQKKYARVQILGYVQNMHDWIEQADLVISKPGGLTVTETIACGKPLIMVKPIPGQEEANHKFVEQYQLGIGIDDLSTIPDILSSIVVESELWKDRKTRIIGQQRKRAAENIVKKTVETFSFQQLLNK